MPYDKQDFSEDLVHKTQESLDNRTTLQNEVVSITWRWEDIQTLRPDWDKKKCLESLDEIHKPLRDRSIEVGWEIIEQLLP